MQTCPAGAGERADACEFVLPDLRFVAHGHAAAAVEAVHAMGLALQAAGEQGCLHAANTLAAAARDAPV